jgi:predicted transposase/invertase (TIGR01784 family)
MFDNLSKFLTEQYSEDFASWLIGEPIAMTELKPTELSLEPIRADSVILLKSEQVTLHCEFQTNPDPDIPFRLADYALRIYRKFPTKRLVQVVIYLRPTDSPEVYKTTFSGNNIQHQFQVIRLWQQPTELFFERVGLLPYAALTQTPDPEAVLRQVAAQIEQIEDRRQQSNLSAAAGVLGALSLDLTVIRRILRRDIMRESAFYQELWEEARAEAFAEVRQELTQEAIAKLRQEAIAEVRQELRQEGQQEGRQEEGRSLVSRLLNRRVGAVSEEARSRIEALSLEQIEALADALLDFSVVEDLTNWLAENLGK